MRVEPVESWVGAKATHRREGAAHKLTATEVVPRVLLLYYNRALLLYPHLLGASHSFAVLPLYSENCVSHFQESTAIHGGCRLPRSLSLMLVGSRLLLDASTTVYTTPEPYVQYASQIPTTARTHDSQYIVSTARTLQVLLAAISCSLVRDPLERINNRDFSPPGEREPLE